MFDKIDLKGKAVLLRLDLNVPVNDARTVTDFTRIDRAKDTVQTLRARGARIIIMAHFGRPKGEPNPKFSLEFLPPVLAQRWGFDIAFSAATTGPVAAQAASALSDADVLLLENIRFNKGEESDDPTFAAALAELGEYYVNDAFSVSHRAHASVHALAKLLPCAAGLGMRAELSALDAAISSPKRPVAAIVGGSKISTKLDLLGNLVQKMDVLVLGGGMANTFLASRGWKPEASLYEPDMLDTARDISAKAEASGCRIVLPVDGVVAEACAPDAKHELRARSDIPAGWQVLDIGPQSVKLIEDALQDCQTILWNGPVGVFEMPAFAKGTNAIASYIAARTKGGVISVAGGGDTVAALSAAEQEHALTYVSTAGGAFLEWLEGKELPGVQILAQMQQAA